MTDENLKQADVVVFVPDNESISQINKMQPAFSLVRKYKTADDWAGIKDKPFRAYYMGLSEIPNEKGEAIVCASFVSTTEFFIAGQKVLVDAVRNLPDKTAIEITYLGKKNNKSSDGSTMIFDVKILK